MLTGFGFLTMALLIAGLVAYHVAGDRGRALAHLDRRIGNYAAPVAAPIRRHGPVPVPELVAPLLAQAQIELTPRSLGILAGVTAAGFLFTLLLLGPTAALLTVALPTIAAIGYVRHRARRRIDGLIEALPSYIDTVRQLISVGNSLAQALVRAVPTSPRAVQTYLASTVRRIELGAPVSDSFQQVADRLRIPEMSMLAAAIRVNIRFGGPMTAVLANLGKVVRERIRIKRELRAATAEIKVSTWVLTAMPLAAMLMLFIINPAYLDFFLNDPRGHRWALIAAILQGLGMLVMRRLMRLHF